MNELQILINQQPGIIKTNFAEVKQILVDQMDIYKSLEVTEENKTERKKDVATLRKLVKAVNDKRIEVKKECLKPYEIFEKQANELIEIINEPIRLLDSQIKEYEDKQRQEKVNTIKQIYYELAGELAEYIALEQIYDNKWENVATSIKSIREDMTVKFNEIKRAIDAIKATGSEKVEEALNRYYLNLDLASAINFINQYEQQKKEIERRLAEQMKKEQEEAIQREIERARQAEREAIEREKQAREAERQALMVKQWNSPTETRLYSIVATPEEFEQVEMYFNSLGLEFERV